MRFCGKKAVWVLSIVLLLACSGVAFGNVVILLKNGRTVDVPVNKDDIVSISFKQTPSANHNISWDFEAGRLQGWTKTGTAFDTQPTHGDNPTARRRGQPSNHQGHYWIGSYENRPAPSAPAGRIQGDGPRGSLTSAPFVISSPTINFLIGGGCDINTERVELLVNGKVTLKATGRCNETMHRISWNVGMFQGQSAQIRLIDASGGGWGHINFDDVNFK